MAEFFTKDDKRTVYCGELRTSDIGKEVTVCGWIQRRRDLGSLIFIDLRDKSGVVQLAFDDATDKEVFDKAFTCRSEYVLSAKGSVRARSSVNKNIPTGEIEIFVTSMKVLSEADTLPFEIGENYNAGEEIALKYRYLDLRRPALQKNIFMRNEITRIARQYFYSNNFTEIETPMMIKSTPEGARDYIIPSRIHGGKFYALPQSPQIYKQLLMISGFDRYIQLARCFRDEDLRADRQPEFTQIDLEMSFVDVDDILDIAEGYIQRLAYADQVTILEKEPENIDGMVCCTTADAKLYIPMGQLVDVAKELERIQKELEKARKNLAAIQGKLNNENFTARAPEAVVNAEREKAAKAEALILQLEQSENAMKKL